MLDGWGNMVLNSKGALTSLESPSRDHLPLPRLCQQRAREANGVRQRAGLLLQLLLVPQNPGVQPHLSPYTLTLSSPWEGKTGPEECEARQPCPQTTGPPPRAQAFPSVLRPGERRKRGLCRDGEDNKEGKGWGITGWEPISPPLCILHCRATFQIFP